MNDFLVDHAIRNVWCNPKQDLQVIYKPQRISPLRGVRTSFNHQWSTIRLPTTTDVYHIFQIGQYAPYLLGLGAGLEQWTAVNTLMESQKLLAQLYTADGRQFSRGESFILVTSNKDVLIAMREQRRIADLRSVDIFVRLYSNAYFSSDRAQSTTNGILCRSTKVTSAEQALDFQRDFLDARDHKPGATWLFVNGLQKDDYRPSDVVVGDYVEYVNDSSVKAVKTFAIANLDTFDSVLDLKRKFLLHYSGDQVDGIGIDYRDDIDVYLTKVKSNGRFSGVYYHKNNTDALRQVTHRDYAVVVDYITAYQQAQSAAGWGSIQDLTLTLYIRRSGYQRPLVFEDHRIQELYKLSETDRYRALVGLDSTVTSWRAEELENSDYVKVMDARQRYITNDLVRDAYGYNAMAKLIGDTPQYVGNDAGRPVVKLPYGLWSNSTAFEYDANGVLINSYVHTAGAEYTPFNANGVLVETLVGRGGKKLDMVFQKQDTPIDPAFSYRYYVTMIDHGVPLQDKWVDVTGDATKYEIVDGKVHWLVDFASHVVCVKSDQYFLNYSLSLTPTNGLVRFSVSATTTWVDQTQDGVLIIPPGKLDLWLNNRALIENLDYFVQWPEIVLTNKAYLNPLNKQTLVVRATGFCQSDLTREPVKEVGFVRWGKLSRNSRYDLRDDRVIRLVADGRVFHRDQAHFVENDPSVWMDAIPNGAPYLLDDLVVPLRQVVDGDTYTLRDHSQAIDQVISDYLTLKLPEDVPETPDPIEDLYAIYSPFTAAIMYDLVNGVLSTEGFRGQYSDLDVKNYLTSYEWLLVYEPTRHAVDLTHVAVHPHDRTTVVELDAYQYFLLNRAIKVFLEDKVDITRFVRIKDSYI